MVKVAISYRVSGQVGLEEKLRELAESHGGKSEDLGCGFGQHDLEFSFRKVKPAKAFTKETRAIIGENSSIAMTLRISALEILKDMRRRLGNEYFLTDGEC